MLGLQINIPIPLIVIGDSASFKRYLDSHEFARKGLVVLSGCAHSGIVSTTLYTCRVTGINRVDVIMGGFHLSGPFFEQIIGRTTEELQKIDPAYIVLTHCTGRKAISRMDRSMPEKFILNMSGAKLTFSA